MKNVYIIVEGDSEEKFINEILAPYFVPKNILLKAEKVITGKDKFGKLCKGGGNNYQYYKNHLNKRIKQFSSNKNYYFSTMIDLYALPSNFPKFEESKNINDKYKLIEFLEESFKEDINYPNFLPYIQLHEFETLLFCDIEKIANEFFDLEDNKLQDKITNDIRNYDNIELINDSKQTAPSKRLDSYTDGEYCGRKTTSSINILKNIDLETLRQKCKHFNNWLKSIEDLANQ